ncbi:hypothetical protein ABHN84_09035 [Shewanella vesiculosa]|uniref:Uncharacterized protein n=1 Tax=Shewanella vesiculosa TaxID=518738 RepID=A0ABV0FNN1_9GAMM|tara:strand:+ start:5983 stop:6435 length:453 start_codon:yes stop_codon:yes gene_type:complete
MAVLGINLEKNGFRYCVLDGSRDAPSLIHYEKVQTNNFPNAQQLMNWYETTFQNLITRFAPESIGIKVSLNAKKAEIAPWYYPLGILHNIAYQNRISTFEFVSGNFTASKFDMDKSINIYDHIDQRFGVFQPKWDKNQKYALLSAWMIMK